MDSVLAAFVAAQLYILQPSYVVSLFLSIPRRQDMSEIHNRILITGTQDRFLDCWKS